MIKVNYIKILSFFSLRLRLAMKKSDINNFDHDVYQKLVEAVLLHKRILQLVFNESNVINNFKSN